MWTRRGDRLMAADTPLSDRQLSVLRAIHELTQERGLPPTMRAVAGRVGSSVEPVWEDVHALRARGHLLPADKGAPRSLRLTDKGLRAIGLEPMVEVPEDLLEALLTEIHVCRPGRHRDDPEACPACRAEQQAWEILKEDVP